ncbi:hypothetical protein CMV00_11800 [Elizabethkingia anophelis]|nr:hypothetical protein [Elizabethkingia anophelis]
MNFISNRVTGIIFSEKTTNYSTYNYIASNCSYINLAFINISPNDFYKINTLRVLIIIMKEKTRFFLGYFLSFIGFAISLSQERNQFDALDPLYNKSYRELNQLFNKTYRISNAQAKIYATTILNKAKKEKNNNKIANGYLLLYKIEKTYSSLSYLDSAIVITKNLKHSEYLSDGYMYKGNFYYLNGEYPKALAYYLQAKEYNSNNNDTYNILNFNIGLLKLELGEYKDAIQLFLNYKQYLERKKTKNQLDYMSCIYALAYTYSQMNSLKKSDYYVNYGLEKSQEAKDDMRKSYLLMVSGINSYKRKDYKSALERLNKISNIIKKNSYSSQNLAICEYYLGKISYDTNNPGFLSKFEKVDSIMRETKNVSGELRETYPLLIGYYKKTGNKEKQLFYIERLLSVDSILNKNGHFLITEINKKYDTPLLLKEKENLLKNLSFRNNILFGLLGCGCILIIGLILLNIKNQQKKRLYKNKAYLLAQQLKSNEKTDKIATKIQLKKNRIGLPDEKLKQLNIKLNEFELNKRFLEKKMNLDILSKEFNTNRGYLSKLVNDLKGQSFPQYLNELRIQYIITELKHNKNLYKLTIAAIAEEAGYSNTESFNTAFKKIAGTLPSYFIKALQNDDLN